MDLGLVDGLLRSQRALLRSFEWRNSGDRSVDLASDCRWRGRATACSCHFPISKRCRRSSRHRFSNAPETAVRGSSQWRKEQPGRTTPPAMRVWGGVRLRDVLRTAGVKRRPESKSFRKAAISRRCSAAFRSVLRMEPTTLIALRMNGEPLPRAHGFPARLIVPGWAGIASTKWLTRLTVSDRAIRRAVPGRSLCRLRRRRHTDSTRTGDASEVDHRHSVGRSDRTPLLDRERIRLVGLWRHRQGRNQSRRWRKLAGSRRSSRKPDRFPGYAGSSGSISRPGRTKLRLAPPTGVA